MATMTYDEEQNKVVVTLDVGPDGALTEDCSAQLAALPTHAATLVAHRVIEEMRSNMEVLLALNALDEVQAYGDMCQMMLSMDAACVRAQFAFDQAHKKYDRRLH